MHLGRRPRTFRLPGGLHVTVVPLDGAATASLLKAAAFHANLYVLGGLIKSQPTDPWDLTDRSWGLYVGMSAELRDRLRAGVSLRQWATQREILDPRVAILIRREGRPLDPDVTVLMETLLIRALFAADRWTMLNSTSGCPTVAARLSRDEAAYACRVVSKLLNVMNGRMLPRGVSGTPAAGGPIREHLIRLVRSSGRPMTTTEIVAEAMTRGIPIGHHGTPTATVRRDLVTRERQGARGPVRVHHTHVRAPSGRREALFYVPGTPRAQAVRVWRQLNNLPVGEPRHRRPRRSA